jgi:hypothetical protein
MTVNTKKAVPKDLIDSLLANYKKPEDLIDELPIDIPRDRQDSFDCCFGSCTFLVSKKTFTPKNSKCGVNV